MSVVNLVFKKTYFYCSSFVFIAKHNKYISAFLK